VRYLDLPRGPRSLSREIPIRILGVVSNPTAYDSLDVERERDNLESASVALTAQGAVELHWLNTPTPAALLEMLRTQPFHALHCIGHGECGVDAEHGFLLFEDESGWAHPVRGDWLGMLMQDFTSIRLAVLNTCGRARREDGRLERIDDPFAGVAGSLAQRGI